MKGVKNRIMALIISSIMIISMFGNVVVSAELDFTVAGSIKFGTQNLKVKPSQSYYYEYVPEKSGNKSFLVSCKDSNYVIAAAFFDEDGNLKTTSPVFRGSTFINYVVEKGKKCYFAFGLIDKNSSYGPDEYEVLDDGEKDVDVSISVSDAFAPVSAIELKGKGKDDIRIGESNVKGLSWDPKTSSLTMDGYNAENTTIYFYNHESYGDSAIELDPSGKEYTGKYYDVIIYVKGKNTLKNFNIQADVGINLIFKGDGELTAENDNGWTFIDFYHYYDEDYENLKGVVSIDGPKINVSGAFEEDIIYAPNFKLKSGTLYMEIKPYLTTRAEGQSGHYGDIYAWNSVEITGGSLVAKYEGLPEGANYSTVEGGRAKYQTVESIDISVKNATIIITGDESTVEKMGSLYVYGDKPLDLAASAVFLRGSSIDISKLKIELSETTYKYDGKAKTPVVNIAGLKEGVDFEVSYKNNVNAGTATVVVTGKGLFKGTATTTFEIVKAADGPKVGTTVKDSNYVYKVTKAGSTDGKIVGEVKLVKLKNKKLKSVKVANVVTINKVKYKVTAIGNKAFKKNKKITKAIIGKNVKTIGNSAFEGCKKLKLVNIKSKKLTKIGKKAFSKCKKLNKIIIKSTKLKKVGKGAVKGTSKKLVIKAPKKKKAAYEEKFKNAGNTNVKAK